MNNRKDKVIDDPKVPAGFFPLYKPKPPFMEFPNGHGFKGVLLEEQATGKLQCHYCGKTFNTLTPHLLKHHKMLPRTYKFEVGLNAHVPLMSSELIRVQRANFTNKTAEEQKKITDRLRKLSKDRAKAGGFKRFKKTRVSVQEQNGMGTCELQTKHDFFQVYRKIGVVPTSTEIPKALYNRINERFPSYDEALREWGFSDDELAEKERRSKQKYLEAKALTNEELRKKMVLLSMSSIRKFIRKHKRLPTWGEFGKRKERETNLPSRQTVLRVLCIKTKDELAKIFSVELDKYVLK